MQYKDYYQVLGVAKGATQDEVRKAFRKLARQHHPDVAKDKRTAETKFKEINEAYEVLGDAQKRREYDELGANWGKRAQQSPPPWNNGFGSQGGSAAMNEEGFSDFFEAFFGGARQPMGGGRRGSSFPGGASGAGAQPKHLEAEDHRLGVVWELTSPRKPADIPVGRRACERHCGEADPCLGRSRPDKRTG